MQESELRMKRQSVTEPAAWHGSDATLPAPHRYVPTIGIFALLCLTRLRSWWAPWQRYALALSNRRKLPQLKGSQTINSTFVAIPLDHRQHTRTDEFTFVLKPSGVNGVGVFATHCIAKGARLELFPNGKIRFFSNAHIEADARLKKFCQFYGVETPQGSFVPANFGCMSVGCYLNHSDTPNAHHKDFDYYASRDIAANEEILIDYRVLW